MLVLGIETSCDETAAAVVRNGREILSSVISSQIDLHRPFGGVVPELAAREHLGRISQIVRRALADASINLKDIAAVAVTNGPGLVGALMVGVNYAKALALGISKPLIGVNHIEGHVYSVAFENPPIEYPALALIVSGGHTNLFLIPKEGVYKIISRTRDDAAGEAFDKVSKMLGLGYPGGPIIERLARAGDPTKFRFVKAKISDGRPDFSFSGLKTAVSRYVRENSDELRDSRGEPTVIAKDLAAGFQDAVVRALVTTTERQASIYRPRNIILAGGVACNLALRQALASSAAKLGVPVYFPSKNLSTDNAAMIAAAGFFHLKRGEASGLDLTADVTLRLQNSGETDGELRARKVRYRL